jgi:hypothetical protein
MNTDATAAFAKGLRGRLIQPTDADYDDARALYNCMIDKRPALIARVANVADIIAAVNFARDEGLLLAVRGGGHNGPGLWRPSSAACRRRSSTGWARCRFLPCRPFSIPSSRKGCSGTGRVTS